MTVGSKTEENLKKATSSLMELIFPIFLPVKNIHKSTAQKIFNKNNGSLIISSVFGGVEIRGRLLAQNHKDILEALLCQETSLVRRDDSISVNFGRYKFLKEIGRSTGNYLWLEEKIKQIRDFNFGLIFYRKDGTREVIGGFGIIDTYRFESDGTMSVKFTKEFADFYRQENLLHYGKYVPKIAKIKEPFLKGIVRYMLQSENWSILFSKIIENYQLKNLVARNEISSYRNLLRDESNRKMLKDDFNIVVEDHGATDFKISINRDNSVVQFLQNNKNPIVKQPHKKSLFEDE